ncbi:DUF551 domain-containing protein [Klebsiella pneumoniae]|uniref:DUF551 domain-containing protein n=1 Tax=Klebsiella pneumoniae TaxID=573 RepID=UPI0039B672B9
MSEFSRETLLNIIETDHVQCGEASALARMALVAMGSEPVAYIDKQWTLVYYVPPMSMGLKIGDKLYRHAQPAPVVPGKWIPVSERMPEIGDIVLTAMGGVVNVGEMECSAANCRFFTSVISGRELPATHWMPLPAAPQEVKGE